MYVTLDQDQAMILTFDTHVAYLTHLLDCMYQLEAPMLHTKFKDNRLPGSWEDFF